MPRPTPKRAPVEGHDDPSVAGRQPNNGAAVAQGRGWQTQAAEAPGRQPNNGAALAQGRGWQTQAAEAPGRQPNNGAAHGETLESHQRIAVQFFSVSAFKDAEQHFTRRGSLKVSDSTSLFMVLEWSSLEILLNEHVTRGNEVHGIMTPIRWESTKPSSAANDAPAVVTSAPAANVLATPADGPPVQGVWRPCILDFRSLPRRRTAGRFCLVDRTPYVTVKEADSRHPYILSLSPRATVVGAAISPRTFFSGILIVRLF
jgi:hypothetical protein